MEEKYLFITGIANKNDAIITLTLSYRKSTGHTTAMSTSVHCQQGKLCKHMQLQVTGTKQLRHELNLAASWETLKNAGVYLIILVPT